MAMQTVQLGGFVDANIKKINDNFANVLPLDNATAFAPTGNYHPATKKYVDDSVAAAGGGDMLKSAYDSNDDNIVNQADKVTNKLTVKVKSGTNEGTDLYSFDGGAAKTLDIKQGDNIILTPAAGELTIAAVDTTYNAMVGATSGAAGAAGLVPAPAAGDQAKVLSGAGAWVPQVDISGKMNKLGSSPSAAGQVLVTKAADQDDIEVATDAGGTPIVIGGATFAGTPNDNTLATEAGAKAYADSVIAAADAMVYKGTIDGGDTGAYGDLTPAADAGDTYKVAVGGKINGVAVEAGDMLICYVDGTDVATAENYAVIMENWNVIQRNIDGAVINSDASVSANSVPIFDGTTGKIIKSSGFTLGKSVPSDAVFTDTVPSKVDFADTTVAGWSETATNGVYTLTLSIPSGRYPAAVFRYVSSSVYAACQVGMQITSGTSLAITSYDRFAGYVVLV